MIHVIDVKGDEEELSSYLPGWFTACLDINCLTESDNEIGQRFGWQTTVTDHGVQNFQCQINFLFRVGMMTDTTCVSLKQRKER